MSRSCAWADVSPRQSKVAQLRSGRREGNWAARAAPAWSSPITWPMSRWGRSAPGPTSSSSAGSSRGPCRANRGSQARWRRLDPWAAEESRVVPAGGRPGRVALAGAGTAANRICPPLRGMIVLNTRYASAERAGHRCGPHGQSLSCERLLGGQRPGVDNTARHHRRRSSSVWTASGATPSQPSISRPRISKRRTCGSSTSDWVSRGSTRSSKAPLAAGADGHVAVDHEREPFERAFLGQSRFTLNHLSDTFCEIGVVCQGGVFRKLTCPRRTF